MWQLINSLAYLHECKNIIHRDIKPANLLVANYDQEKNLIDVKLTDFGFAAEKEGHQPNFTNLGTQVYKAPEFNNSEGHSTKADIWSAGVMAFYFLSEG